MTHILVATDAWHPQVNGVVRTLTMMAEAAQSFGVDISFLTPQSFRTFAMPSYPDLRLALPSPAKIASLIEAAKPDGIHIATEGPIGFMVRQARAAVHNELPHPLSRICLGAFADPGSLGVVCAALVLQAEPGGDGRNAGAGD